MNRFKGKGIALI